MATFASLFYVHASYHSMSSVADTQIKYFFYPFMEEVENSVSSVHLFNGYGLFRQMTGVGAIQNKVLKKDHTNLFGFNISGHVPAYVMRPEVHLEGLDPIIYLVST